MTVTQLVISFSVINYVVSMRHPRASGEVSFFCIYPSIQTLSLLVIPSFKEIAVLLNDGSKLGDFRADFDTIVTKKCTFM